MALTGLHFLLTYQCTAECDHCFVWGSPRASGGVFSLTSIRDALRQAREAGIGRVCFEGGEPFLYYPLLLEGLREAARLGLSRGVVTNCYWATTPDDALLWLGPLAEVGAAGLSVSTDCYHGDSLIAPEAVNAARAARTLGLPLDVLVTVADPEPAAISSEELGRLTPGTVMYRGRAARKLAGQQEGRPWQDLTRCPHEDLANPSRVHLDPQGWVHLCQGLTVGRLGERRLAELLAAYDPRRHPVVGPLLEGGPAALARAYGLAPRDRYADACHLCYELRDALRPRFPETLAPGQMYGEGLGAQ